MLYDFNQKSTQTWRPAPAGNSELEVDAELKRLLRPLMLSTRARLAEEHGGELAGTKGWRVGRHGMCRCGEG